MEDQEKRKKELENFKKLLRSVVLSSPRGVPIYDLCREFRAITYEEMPFRKHGLRSAEELLRLCPDTVVIIPDGGTYIVRAVADQATAHMQELISKQKKGKKKARKGPPPGRSYQPPGSARGRPFGSGPRFGSYVPTLGRSGPLRSGPMQPFMSARVPQKSVFPPAGGNISVTTGSSGRFASSGFAAGKKPVGVSSAPSPSSQPMASNQQSYGNPVTDSSPDTQHLEKQFVEIISDSKAGLFLPRLLVLYAQRYRRDLPKEVALRRMSQMQRITVEAIQSNHILYVKSPGAAATKAPATAASRDGTSSGSANSTRPASATTAGLATTSAVAAPSATGSAAAGKKKWASPPPSPETDDLIENPVADKNYKNMLMTYVVKRFGSGQQYTPVYEHFSNEDGTFTASVRVGTATFYGEGSAAKKAHFAAAREALQTFQSKAPRAAEVPRSVLASEIDPVSEITNKLARSVYVTESDDKASGTNGSGSEDSTSSSDVPATQVVRMKPLMPLQTSPYPPSCSVWKEVRQKKGYLDVHITCVQGPYCVYATLYENRGLCQELDIMLQQYVAGCETELTPLRNKKENSVCLVRNEEGHPFRAVIEYLDMKMNQVMVRYLDHGDIDSVAFDEVYELPPDLYWPEYQAFKMVLQNLTAAGDDIEQLTEDLEELILEKDMVADVLYQMDLSDERLWVDLWDTSKAEDIHVNEVLRKRYKATQDFNLDLPDVGNSLLVRITQVVAGAHNMSIFVQRAQNSSFINKMVQRMTRHFEESDRINRAQFLLSEDELAVNRKCCVRYTDDKWYRCVVKSILPGKDNCEVYFLDYGYTSVVRRIQLRQMYSDEVDSGDILHLPPQCRECHLAGLPASFVLTREMEEYLNAVTEQALSLTVVEKGVDDAPGKVKITFAECGTDVDLSTRFQDICHGRFSLEQMSEYVAAVNGQYVDSASGSEQVGGSGVAASSLATAANDCKRPVQLLVPSLPLPKAEPAGSSVQAYIPVYILHATSPDSFAASLATADMLAQYNELEEILDSDPSLRSQPAPAVTWSVGDVCAAPSEGTFVRGRIVSLSSQHATVFLLDDGGNLDVNMSDLRELPERAWECPFQVFFGKLFGVVPTRGPQWDSTALDCFSQLTQDKTLQARFFSDTFSAPAPGSDSRKAPTCSLQLVDVSGERDAAVMKELINRGHALQK
eukprot:scpid20816/ scgid21665/ Tudor domain-containing protein 7B